jgi:hypothetical protein
MKLNLSLDCYDEVSRHWLEESVDLSPKPDRDPPDTRDIKT